MEAGETAQAAGKRSWRREAFKAALLSAAMIGALGACWAGAKYHKHVRAAFIAWRWATDGEGRRYSLRDRLWQMKAPRDAGVLAAKIAYRLASDEPRRTAAAETAAWYGGLQAVYDLARSDARGPHGPDKAVYTYNGTDDIGDMPMTRATGGSSPAARVLALCFHELEVCSRTFHSIEKAGAGEFWWTDNLPEVAGELTAGDDFVEQERGSWRFGSYRVIAYSYWSYQINEEGESSWVPISVSAHRVIMERLPGPWRELPPATPRQELSEEDFEPL